MKGYVSVPLMTIMLISCGGGGGGNSPVMPRDGGVPTQSALSDEGVSIESVPRDEGVSMESTSSLMDAPPTQFDSGTWGFWASFDHDYFRVEETMMTDSGSHWTVHGTPTGLVDNLPQTRPQQRTFNYTGYVWGRVYEGRTGRIYTDEDDGDRVQGELWAVYGPRDHYGPGADDVLTIHLNKMYKELPGGYRTNLPAMLFHGDVGTNRNDPDYDPSLDIATFTLPADQFDTTPGREEGEVTGSFYGPNGEAMAGTFWYRRGGHRIEGAFGGEQDE